jgi:hypothetical protein
VERKERVESGDADDSRHGNAIFVLSVYGTMRRVNWLHVVAGVWLVLGGLAGLELVLWSGLVPTSQGDCPPFPQCYNHGHPYDWIGVLVLIVAVVGTVILWRIGTNLRSGHVHRAPPRTPLNASY